ncbi:cdc42 homolog [Mizuhopecten yessoensis]|uniref:Rho-related GTP-binding protein RhoQ n=1 Tax=Mizuhopecten yessoensis TaxID=6573 RepID=A0A210Q9Q6_MIZYE|nr:cdc42 homolog [Mizuhopecten yessoensis]OWF45464.1 Rho-related GTP-binding protein RhoQ [Mizuhopecten yessoensis]
MADDGVDEERKIKVTAVGDCGVGKTCLLMTYATNKFPDSDVPGLYECSQTVKAGRSTSFEVPVEMQFNGCKYSIGLTDTIGSDEYRRIRELFTVGTDIFLVCFSVTEPDTLTNVKQNWLSEIKILAPKATFVLVGTKTDLREDETVKKRLKEKDQKVISIQEGIKCAKTFGAKTYVECSALNQIGLKEVFETVVMVTSPEKGSGPKPGTSGGPCVVS